jgi:hypothetical protein
VTTLLLSAPELASCPAPFERSFNEKVTSMSSASHYIPCDSMYERANKTGNRLQTDIARRHHKHAPLVGCATALPVKSLEMMQSGNIQVPTNGTDQPGTIPWVIPYTCPQYYSERNFHTRKIVQVQGKA